MSDPLRILLADAHASPRRALEGVLAHEQGLTVVASVASVADAGEAARRLRPDVVVVDSDLVSRSANLLEGWGPVDAALPVVVVGLEIHPMLEQRVLRQGGAAYLLKEQLADELPAVLRTIASAGAPHAPVLGELASG